MSATAAVSRSWKVGDRTVTLTIPRSSEARPLFATAEWSPSEPPRLTRRELHEYRYGRNAALTSLADELGINVAVLDL